MAGSRNSKRQRSAKVRKSIGNRRPKRRIGRWILLALIILGIGFSYRGSIIGWAQKSIDRYAVLFTDREAGDQGAAGEKETTKKDVVEEFPKDRRTAQGTFLGINTTPWLRALFPVRHLEVRGVTVIPEDTILCHVQLPDSISLFEVDLRGIEKQIETIPRVKDVLIERKFPSTLLFRVEEREELAFLLNRGKIYSIDRDGCIFPPPRGGWKRERPVLTGYDQKIEPLQVLGENGIREALEWLSLARSYPRVYQWMQEIHIGENRVSYFMGTAEEYLKPGTHSRRSQIVALDTYLAGTANRRPEKVIIDLQFPEFLIVKPLHTRG